MKPFRTGLLAAASLLALVMLLCSGTLAQQQAAWGVLLVWPLLVHRNASWLMAYAVLVAGAARLIRWSSSDPTYIRPARG